MTATYELRRMLDERGVEYETFSGAFATKTCWPCANGLTAIFVEYNGGTTRFEMSRWPVAPEQAIAATFEPVRGECEADETETIACRCYGDPHGKAVYHIHVMECTECGHTYEHVNGDYEYCPRCGRKRRDFVE